MGDLPPAAFVWVLCVFNYGRFVGIPVIFSVFLCIFRKFGCQYQCDRLPGKTGLLDDLLCRVGR